MECPIEYSPEEKYSQAGMVEKVKAQRELLCFFALSLGEKVLGLEFDSYNRERQSVPVMGLPSWIVKELMRVEGKGFKQAVAASGVGRSIVVTWTGPFGSGWVALKWAVGEVREYGVKLR